MMKIIASAIAVSMLCSGCVTLHTYNAQPPTDPNTVRSFKQGVGTIMSKDDDGEIVIYPTFRLNNARAIPSFSIYYLNKSLKEVDFSNANIKVFFRGVEQQLYTFEERTAEIRTDKVTKQVLLAIVGAVAAAGAAHAASNQTSSYSSYGNVWNNRGGAVGWRSGGVIRTHDPLAGMVAGGAVTAGTVVGINQIERDAGNEERAAAGILQQNTLPSFTSIDAQILIRKCCDATASPNDIIRIEVTANNKMKSFEFKREVIEAK